VLHIVLLKITFYKFIFTAFRRRRIEALAGNI